MNRQQVHKYLLPVLFPLWSLTFFGQFIALHCHDDEMHTDSLFSGEECTSDDDCGPAEELFGNSCEDGEETECHYHFDLFDQGLPQSKFHRISDKSHVSVAPISALPMFADFRFEHLHPNSIKDINPPSVFSSPPILRC